MYYSLYLFELIISKWTSNREIMDKDYLRQQLCIKYGTNFVTYFQLFKNKNIFHIWNADFYAWWYLLFSISVIFLQKNISLSSVFQEECSYRYHWRVMAEFRSALHWCSFWWNGDYWHVGVETILITKFMGPTWGPSGADRTQVGPVLGPRTLPSG